MRISFDYAKYENIAPIDLPDDRVMGVWSPHAVEQADETAEIRRALGQPVGAPPLREAARGKNNILILIDDATRSTPTDKLLPHVLEELHAAGIRDEQVQILTAQGTHRKMNPQELQKKTGAIPREIQLHQHNWKDDSQLHDFGTTRDGTPVRANRLVAQADFVIGIGGIVPHRVKGFGGGAKIMFPGVSGPEMMERNQWEASMHLSRTVMGVAENSMRLRMEEAAAIAGLHYIVNVVQDARGQIAGCFAGDVTQAHRRGCTLSRDLAAAHLPGRADIVLIDSYPADRDFWQSAKGLYAATMAVRTGGVIVLVSPNPEGVADNHPNMLEIGYRPHAQLVSMVHSGKAHDLVGMAILADVAQILDQARVLLVSPGIRKPDAEHLGMSWMPDGNAAMDAAFGLCGKNARVAVLHHGGHILPLAR